MNPLLGVYFHWLGGLASGSFYVPFRGVKRWSRETAWLVAGVFSWIIAPWFFVLLNTKDVLAILVLSTVVIGYGNMTAPAAGGHYRMAGASGRHGQYEDGVLLTKGHAPIHCGVTRTKLGPFGPDSPAESVNSRDASSGS